MNPQINPQIEKYMKMVCNFLDIDWEDYWAQLNFEFPLFWAAPNQFISSTFADVLLAFLDLDLGLYRKIGKDIDRIAQGDWIPFELSPSEKRWLKD